MWWKKVWMAVDWKYVIFRSHATTGLIRNLIMIVGRCYTSSPDRDKSFWISSQQLMETLVDSHLQLLWSTSQRITNADILVWCSLSSFTHSFFIGFVNTMDCKLQLRLSLFCITFWCLYSQNRIFLSYSVSVMANSFIKVSFWAFTSSELNPLSFCCSFWIWEQRTVVPPSS